MDFQKGDIVRPKYNGDKIAWTRLKGRILDMWASDGTMGEPVADVVWFTGPHKRTVGYPLEMLVKI